MAQDSPTRKPRHSPEQVERGLQAVAQADGNTRTAAERLAQGGSAIPRSTLRNWQRQHLELYKRLVAQLNTPAEGHAPHAGVHANAQALTPSPRLDMGRRLPAQGTEAPLRPEARTQANGNRASVLAGARELIAQRLADLDRERQELEQHLAKVTGGRL